MDPTLQYFVLMFGGCLGVYQIGAALGGFRGLRFLRKRLPTLVCGLVIVAAVYIWFFKWGDVKMNSDPSNPEVEGFQQLCIFLLASFLALVVNYALASLINFRYVRPKDEAAIRQGLEDLKERTVFQAIRYRWENRKADNE